MIPSNTREMPTELVNQPSLTYALDMSTNRIQGKIDGLEAVEQAVKKVLYTERFAYVIYNDQYGIEMEGLYGKSEDFVKSVLESRIRDAFLNDERILDFEDFSIDSIEKNHITYHVTVISNYGKFKATNH